MRGYATHRKAFKRKTIVAKTLEQLMTKEKPAVGAKAKERSAEIMRNLPLKKPIKVPNAKTQKAIAQLESGKGRRAKSVADLMAKLDAYD